MKKTPIVFGGIVALTMGIGLSAGFSASWPVANWNNFVMPRAARTYLVQRASSNLVGDAKRAVADLADREAKIALAPATDDGLVAEVTQQTMQDGTITRWDGDTKYLEPNIVTKTYLKVTAKIDSIILKNIEINRGNCAVLNYATPLEPLNLKFGESTHFMVICDPVEAKIGTDHGLYSFSW